MNPSKNPPFFGFSKFFVFFFRRLWDFSLFYNEPNCVSCFSELGRIDGKIMPNILFQLSASLKSFLAL